MVDLSILILDHVKLGSQNRHPLVRGACLVCRCSIYNAKGEFQHSESDVLGKIPVVASPLCDCLGFSFIKDSLARPLTNIIPLFVFIPICHFAAMPSAQCELYLYTPSLPLAVVAVITFSALTSIHVFRMIQAKTWTGLFFVLGGLGRLAPLPT